MYVYVCLVASLLMLFSTTFVTLLAPQLKLLLLLILYETLLILYETSESGNC